MTRPAYGYSGPHSASMPCVQCGTRPRQVAPNGKTYNRCSLCLRGIEAAGTFRLSLAPGRGSALDRTRFVLDTPNMHEAGELDHWQLTPWLDAALRWANRHDLDKVVTVWPLPSEAFDCLLAERLIARQLAIYSVQAYGLPVDEDDED